MMHREDAQGKIKHHACLKGEELLMSNRHNKTVTTHDEWLGTSTVAQRVSRGDDKHMVTSTRPTQLGSAYTPERRREPVAIATTPTVRMKI